MKKLLDYLRNTDFYDVFVAKQEYGGAKDQFGRFLYKFCQNKDVSKPVVSDFLIKNGFLDVNWPENHRFAACLTHDVESIYPTWKYTLFTAAKFASKLELKNSLRRIIAKNKKSSSENPFWNFKQILKLEDQYDGKSSFYFKATLRDIVNWIYDIEDLTDELHSIIDMGGEVGLHGGFFSYNNPEELKKEKKHLEKALNKETIGVRMHYLRFEVPETWRILSDLGFKYDTTYGFPDMPGFRNGMCHPFKPYDLNLGKEIDIMEIPLIIMDGSLFGLPIDEAWTIVQNLIDITEKNKGVITILWHSNNFDKIFNGNKLKFYEKILSYLKNKNAWMTSGADIYDYWRRNKYFRRTSES